MVEFDIKIGSKELYDFMLMHSYTHASGLLGSVIGALCIVVGFSAKYWILLIAGIVLLLYLPWTLWIKSKQQAILNPGFKEPLHYMIDGEGITISQGEACEKQTWDKMVKAVSTGRSIIVYTSKVNATIFPKEQLGDNKDALVELISTHMSPKDVKIRS